MNIFIVGVGRSGTSLLHSMVGAHPEITAVPETSFLRRYAFAPNVNLKALEQDKKLDRFSPLKEQLDAVGFQKNKLIQAYSSATNDLEKNHVVDKDPRLVEYIPLLHEAFPSCKIIHIFRDPRDVLASKKAAAWASNHSLLGHLVASRVQIAKAWQAERDKQIFSVQYENLIGNPEQVLRDICDYLQISFHSSLLDYTETARNLVTDEEYSWKKETLSPVNSENTGKWVSKLTQAEAAAAMWVAPSVIARGNYEASEVVLSLNEYIKAKVLQYTTVALSFAYNLKNRLGR